MDSKIDFATWTKNLGVITNLLALAIFKVHAWKSPVSSFVRVPLQSLAQVLSVALEEVSSLSPHQSTNLRFPFLKVASSYYMSKNTDDLCQTHTETRCLCWHINTKNCYHRKISPSKPGLKLIWTDIQRPRWVTFVHTRICLLRDFLVHVNWLPEGID